jgi:hypothetical protein
MTLDATKGRLPIALHCKVGMLCLSSPGVAAHDKHSFKDTVVFQKRAHFSTRCHLVLRPPSSDRVTPAPASAVTGRLCPITTAASAMRPVRGAGLGLALTLGTDCLLLEPFDKLP